jgi:hypothetical protein
VVVPSSLRQNDLEARMVFLTGDPDLSAITNLINPWIHIGQALVASVGALALIGALLCMP